MENKIRIGIIGYGNLGRGVEIAIKQQQDMELIAIFSRRGSEGITSTDPLVVREPIDQVNEYIDKIDIMILCGGSARDLPQQTPHFTQWFNTVDSFDNHSNIPDHYAKVDQVAKDYKKVSIISAGWDPGLFSLQRVYSEAFLTNGETYTFWGKGLSQGHSDAVRRVKGVLDGVQYTIPSEEAMQEARQGLTVHLTSGDRHRRQCFIVAERGADKNQIIKDIITMPGYFADYETQVNFIDQETLKREHSSMPHGGKVIRSGKTGENNNQLYEFSLNLGSNPEFTSSILVATARAAFKMSQEKQSGCFTMLDIPPKYYSTKTNSDLRKDDL